MSVTEPFDTFHKELQAGEYKSFGLPDDDPYPLKGVTYPVPYGDIPGYIGEDGDDLDVFMGDEGHHCGWFTVKRPDVLSEHKVYVNLTDEEQSAVLHEFEPVIVEHQEVSLPDLVKFIETFKKK